MITLNVQIIEKARIDIQQFLYSFLSTVPVFMYDKNHGDVISVLKLIGIMKHSSHVSQRTETFFVMPHCNLCSASLLFFKFSFKYGGYIYICLYLL